MNRTAEAFRPFGVDPLRLVIAATAPGVLETRAVARAQKKLLRSFAYLARTFAVLRDAAWLGSKPAPHRACAIVYSFGLYN
ncbi:hypothetical protein Q3C01_08525 [Bradyrhizobium sp. UFLA05-109]